VLTTILFRKLHFYRCVLVKF